MRQLTGEVVHDVRNQLFVIDGFARMLLNRALVRDEGRGVVEEILKAAEKSTTLARQLLAADREAALRPELIDLAESIHDISKSLMAVVGEDIRLSVVADTIGCYAKVDPERFRRAVTNLVMNARDAMPQGGELKIEVARIDFEGDATLPASPCVMVDVSDTGCGMDSKTLERICEPFFTTKEAGKGTGLGLSMTYAFVRLSGGTLRVTSTLGERASFRLYFPQADTLGRMNTPTQPEGPQAKRLHYTRRV